MHIGWRGGQWDDRTRKGKLEAGRWTGGQWSQCELPWFVRDSCFYSGTISPCHTQGGWEAAKTNEMLYSVLLDSIDAVGSKSNLGEAAVNSLKVWTIR